MADDIFTHIPIHIRLTERHRIDPNYNPEDYHKHERLLGLVRAAGRWYARRTVPECVVKWIGEDAAVRLGPAAVAIKMEAEDLRAIVRRYKG